VLRLHKFDGLSHGEVAARLGISKSAVEKHTAEVSDSPRRLEDGGGPDTVETGAK
jgi:RNA polymerase sigma-70 factor (ECF subfamily)